LKRSGRSDRFPDLKVWSKNPGSFVCIELWHGYAGASKHLPPGHEPASLRC